MKYWIKFWPLLLIAPLAQADQALLHKNARIAFIGNTFIDQLRLNGYVETRLTLRRPDHDLKFRNFGWSADTLTRQTRPFNFTPLETELAKFKADTIVAGFGMAESFAGVAGVDQFKQDWKPLIERFKSKKLILLTPIAYEFIGAVTPDHAKRNEIIRAYAEAVKEVAQKYNLACIDLYSPTAELMQDSEGSRLTHNGIHLTAYGYWAISQILADALAPITVSNRLEYDANGKKGFSFSVEPSHLPAPPSPSPTPASSLAEHQPQLKIKNLKPGTYTLKVGEEVLATFNHRSWAVGVTLTNRPAAAQTESLRQAIMTKNGSFFRRWRPLNTVHIVGQRKSSPSGRALPAELLEMDKTIDQQEREIPPLSHPPKKQIWALVPVTD